MGALIALMGGVGLLGLCITVLSIIRGWTISVLWGWFIVPQFGLPALNIPFAIGLAMIVGILTQQDTATKDGNTSWWAPWISPFLTLFIGWIVTQFI